MLDQSLDLLEPLGDSLDPLGDSLDSLEPLGMTPGWHDSWLAAMQQYTSAHQYTSALRVLLLVHVHEYWY